eukprot:CAMPEP_0113311654 /NCGR_PEP_ID=MMETSP0010_2-20120614/8800_1 /TAXON_ID=216773 ORGANISM="Corethron hystrix, Strain 308" /NCGR_SAMPLE_ID=MMETSP0010_2 /ASSEMBLY_ACC=CAM_ASM_000155 /LENGTH=147 /DNA_ID=CAMNT_0000167327 /DNA_START=119 /DNA_END=562 /DNA_ORIENTATION=- /assembly_acc=CAM_ASM_000155
MKFSLSLVFAANAVTGAFAFNTFSGAVSKPRTFERQGAFNRGSVVMNAFDATAFAKSEIESNDVVVFSKQYCPFCRKTKKLFSTLEIDAKVIELDQMEEGAAIQEALQEISGQRTVPNVFIKGEHLGGNDDTQAAGRSGKLQEMLGK